MVGVTDLESRADRGRTGSRELMIQGSGRSSIEHLIGAGCIMM